MNALPAQTFNRLCRQGKQTTLRHYLIVKQEYQTLSDTLVIYCNDDIGSFDNGVCGSADL